MMLAVAPYQPHYINGNVCINGSVQCSRQVSNTCFFLIVRPWSNPCHDLLQDRVLRTGVNIEPTSDAVAAWSIFLGTFMASFDLKAFPFDAQRLHVQMEVPGWAGGNVVLKPSSAGTRMFNTNPGGRWAGVSRSTAQFALCGWG